MRAEVVAAPVADRTGSALEVRDLRVVFGGLHAVDELSLSVAGGELFGVVGPNGAGKTTLLNAISGLLRLDAGEILLDGARLNSRRPDQIAALGVSRTFQAAEVFNDLKVIDYVLMGRFIHQPSSALGAALRLRSTRRVERRDRAASMSLLSSYGVAHLAAEALKDLPYGLRKLVDLLRAMLGAPGLLLLDEPTSGTAREDRAMLRSVVQDARSRGITIVVVDHDVQFVSDLCDRVLVMNFGRELGTGRPADVLGRPDVQAAYVGLEGD
jgi:branched-chain amino acid transport system ATP-binding protein